MIIRLNWNNNNTDEQSVLAYLEENSVRIRAKYVAFISNLGDLVIKGKSLENHLELSNGHNLWWMTQLVEKSLYKSPQLSDCLKLLALEEMLNVQKPSQILLSGSNKSVNQVIANFCLKSGIKCNFDNIEISKQKFKNIYHFILAYIPFFLRTLTYFFYYIWERWSLKKVKDEKWFSGDNVIFCFSYFLHLDKSKSNLGEFAAGYWGEFSTFLSSLNIKTNWAHHFFLSSVVPNNEVGINLLDNFNKKAKNREVHKFIDSYLTIKLLIKVLKRYVQLLFKVQNFSSIRHYFYVENSEINLWPLLRQDWKKSIEEYPAIQNLLWIELFESIFSTLPKQKMGFYLQENQGWEFAFINAWRKHGHGKLIAVQTATIRHWDLRYFDNPVKLSMKNYLKPKPDYFAVNGPSAKNYFISSGYSKKSIIELESLRYLQYDSCKLNDKYSFKKNYPIKSPKINILILGDYLPRDTELMMNCILLLKDPLLNINWTVKFHPGYRPNVNKYITLNMQETNETLYQILPQFDFVISAGSSTAGLDAYMLDIKVIVFLANGTLNLSPLRDTKDVSFVRSSDELKAIIINKKISNPSSNSNTFFYTDKNLPRWRKLFADSGY